MTAAYDDIVLVTVDCWRHDAPPAMDSLQASPVDYRRRDAICQAPATRGAFPALLAGQYYPQVYDAYDEVADGVRSLPEVLADRGYATGAVVGSNPFLSAWRDRFDYFWNDDLAFGDGDDGRFEASSKLGTFLDYARMRSRVTASEVADRARAWYESADPPRFLWMHLMDVHVPFLPGLRRGLREGPLSVYGAHYRFMQDPESVSAADRRTLERLYWRSVDYLDEQLPDVLGVDPDATTVVVGDHGEEFDHGKCAHARLYDEVVRVPLFVTPDVADALGDESIVRQLDVPAALLASQGLSVPDSWEVEAPPADPRPAFVLNHSPTFDRVYAGVRTADRKLIRTYDEDRPLERPISTEAYDLAADPGETHDRYGEDPGFEGLERHLDEFLEREEIRTGVLERPSAQPSSVEDRLQALGYK